MTDAHDFILGVQHFCDHRCWRCPLAMRCRVHERWSRTGEPARLRRQPAARVAHVVKTAMHVTLEELAEVAQLCGLPLDGPSDASSAGAAGLDLMEEDRRVGEMPLAIAAREYGDQSWSALRRLRDLPAVRRDRDAFEACDTLEEMCFGIVSKIVRALKSAAGPDHDAADLQSDANGAAKVALLLIEESRQAWRLLMQPGRARGGGAPAAFVSRLDALEAGLLESFPRAFEFVRPGFDTGALPGAAGEIARAMLAAGGRSRTN